MRSQSNFGKGLDELRLTTAWFLEQKVNYEKSYSNSPFRGGAVSLRMLDSIRIAFERCRHGERANTYDESDGV
jgi:hypothetical protein